MAEIKIEKKKPVWPWILLVLVLIVGVYIYWSYNDNLNERDQNEMVTDTIPEMNEEFNEMEVDTTTIMEVDSTSAY